jgi:LDH2 family malate/lactate/ureidoglycolate dehydrogenase
MRYEQRAPAVGHLDADNGFGHLAGYRAIEHGCEVAERFGIASVAVSNSSHYGAGGSYAIAAAERGFIALAFSHSDACVAPHDGVHAFNGTNPISFAAPVPGDEPVLVDLATSNIAWNRLPLLQARGLPMPDDVALAGDGTPATDFAAAAALLPLGGPAFGHKGAALAAMVEILSSALSGMVHGVRLLSMASADLSTPRRLGHCFIIMQPAAFVPQPGYEASMRAYLADLRAQPAAGDRPVQAPGDPEKTQLGRRTASGLPIEVETWQELRDAAQRYGTTLPTTGDDRA